MKRYIYVVMATMIGSTIGMMLGTLLGTALFSKPPVVQTKIIEKEIVKYVEVEKNAEDTDVTAEKVDNFIVEAKSVAQPIEYYPLTEQEYTELCEVVMAEAGAECYEGQMAVAQCILNACLKEDIRPTKAITLYKYTPIRKTATDSVKMAVNAVFKNGEKVTDEEILYFYAPKYTTSKWHESQRFVVEIGGHRFFAQWL